MREPLPKASWQRGQRVGAGVDEHLANRERDGPGEKVKR